jgi:hypothetical protein
VLRGQHVDPAVPVRVEQLDAGLGQRDAGRQVGDRARLGEPAGAEVPPVPRRAVELDEVGQPAAEQVGQAQRRVGERLGRQGRLGDRGERAAGRRPRCVPELDRWGEVVVRLAVVVVPDELDAPEQRDPVGRLGVLQAVAAYGDVGAGVHGDVDRPAA